MEKQNNKELINNLLIRNKVFIILSILTLLTSFIILSSPLTSPQTTISGAEVSVCCEKTISGAYCQNEQQSECDPSFRSTATSCEATSFCKKGCCYDSDEGVCMENTPEEACKASNGVWSDSPTCEVPQCDLGCCILGDQAAYVPLVRCKKLSSLYGLQTDFRTNVPDEISCIAIAQAQDVGACIFESEFTRTCKFTTRGECNSQELQGLTNASVEFYKDYLCSAEELNTNCGKSTQTSCIDGKSEVYFLDTCGNQANIYDASKINDIDYWTKVKTPEESCNANSGNSNSKSCGNCDYLSGSICGSADKTAKPSYGNNICVLTDCKDTSNGKDYKNGESWCYYDDKKEDTDSVGSRHFRHICIMGEEIVEPCEDSRNEICVGDSIENTDFSQAGCVVNRWQECVLQNSSGDCLNSDQRDCEWIVFDLENQDLKKGITGKLKGALSNVGGGILGGNTVQDEIDERFEDEVGRCSPKYSPGLEFWDSQGTAAQQCSIGDQSCVVKYTKKLIGDWECEENCECLDISARVLANNYCSSLGDCGAKANYIGRFVDKGYEITVTKDGSQEVKASGQGGGSAQPSNNGGGLFDQPNPPSGDQNFAGPQGGNFQGPATSTGSVIQGLVVKSYNKVIGLVEE